MAAMLATIIYISTVIIIDHKGLWYQLTQQFIDDNSFRGLLKCLHCPSLELDATL